MPSAPTFGRARCSCPGGILVVLEGEGPANDATALVLYRFAVAAVSAGMFSLGEAVTAFAAIVAGELVGASPSAWLMLRLRRWSLIRASRLRCRSSRLFSPIGRPSISAARASSLQ